MLSPSSHTTLREEPVLSLSRILDRSWRLLEMGGQESGEPFHTPSFATMGARGPRARTVALLRVDRLKRSIQCYTDARSAKAREIRNALFVSWLFYDPGKRVQIRLEGPSILHSDDLVATEAWATLPPANRRGYHGLAPGSRLKGPRSGLPEHMTQRFPSRLESEAGRLSFAVLSCEITEMEWLDLNWEGHRRARFLWTNEALEAEWLSS